MPAETIAEWKSRKRAQVQRAKAVRADIGDDPGFENGTKFILVWRRGDRVAETLVIGQLQRDAVGQQEIDLSDAQIDEWIAKLPPAP